MWEAVLHPTHPPGGRSVPLSDLLPLITSGMLQSPSVMHYPVLEITTRNR